MKKPVPERIDLTEKEAEQLINRINSSGLSNDDQTILIGILHFCLWLQLKLTKAKITIRKLSKIFGISSEKRSNTPCCLKNLDVQDRLINDLDFFRHRHPSFSNFI